jgi:hypothetical protein
MLACRSDMATTSIFVTSAANLTNQWHTQDFGFVFGGGSTNSVEDRGQIKQGCGGRG